jgi:hypothetical protein
MAIGSDNNDKELLKKYNDLDKKGITSVYWKEVREVITQLEIREEYEKCQELWEYLQMIGGPAD